MCRLGQSWTALFSVNGDLGVVIGGRPEEQRFYFGKNDFWSRQASPMSVGGLILNIPTVAGASYRQEQDLAKSEVRGTITIHGVTLKARSWAQASENLAVNRTKCRGPYRLGRWYFNGLIDEVGLIRHWGFEADQATNSIETPSKYVFGPSCTYAGQCRSLDL